MRQAAFISRRTNFSFDGANFQWSIDSRWHTGRYILTKREKGEGEKAEEGEEKMSSKRKERRSRKLEGSIVARSAQEESFVARETMGLLAVDDCEIDWRIAVLTYVVLLRNQQVNNHRASK